MEVCRTGRICSVAEAKSALRAASALLAPVFVSASRMHGEEQR